MLSNPHELGFIQPDLTTPAIILVTRKILVTVATPFFHGHALMSFSLLLTDISLSLPDFSLPKYLRFALGLGDPSRQHEKRIAETIEKLQNYLIHQLFAR